MRYLFLATLALTLKWVEYRFNRDYGDFFFDYSLNGRYGVNGNSSSLTKVKSCDRGVYLKNSESFISISKIGLYPAEFTMSAWILSKDALGIIFYYSDSNLSFMIGRGFSYDIIRFYIFSTVSYGTQYCFISSKI